MFAQYFRFSAASARAARRCALLEHLLARAHGDGAVRDWRADAFRVLAPQSLGVPAIAAAALFSEQGAVDGAWVCLATPVHYLADMSSVRMPLQDLLSLEVALAESLAADFNRLWRDSGVRLQAGRAGQLYCVFDRALNVSTHDPEDVLGRHIEELLPAGSDAPRLRLLMSEMEMWLFEHAANRARQALGAPTISGLWLWGGSAPLRSLPPIEGWIVGNDPFFSAFGASANEATHRGVIIAAQAPGSDDWQRSALPHLQAAAAHLRAGRIAQLQLSAGKRCYTLTARAARAFWRRRKPWWESFA